MVLLSKTFLNDFCKDNKLGPITLTKEAAKVLMEYKWPGNIRELKAVIERAAIMSENATIQPEDLISLNNTTLLLSRPCAGFSFSSLPPPFSI